MSATGRGSNRNAFDFYPTPDWAVRAFFRARPTLPIGGVWWECCAGDGALIRAARREIPHAKWVASDIQVGLKPYLMRVADEVMMGDFLKFQAHHVDAIMTNPPYSHAAEIIEHALANAEHVIMLLRLNYLGAQKRADFFKKMAPDVYVLPRRPSFKTNKAGKPGGDATEYAWFHWGPQRFRRRGYIQVLNLEDCQ